MKKLCIALAQSAVVALMAMANCATLAQAVELLVNGNLESAVGPEMWTAEQSVTGLPGAGVNASEQIGFANNPPDEVGGLGIFLRPFAGNQGAYAGQNRPINYILSQTLDVAASAAGKTWKFSGDTYFAGDGVPGVEIDDGFSGGVTTLHAMSPSSNPAGDYNENDTVDAADYVVWRKALGQVGQDPPPELPREAVSGGMIDQADYDFWRSRFGVTATSTSPTQTTFEIAFLDINGNLLASPVVKDLRTEQMNDAMWRTSVVEGVAPANTRKVRVTAAARDMVENFGFQDAYFDNFKLERSDISGTDFLASRNGNLNTPGEPNGYVVTEGPGTPPPDTIGFRDFADHTHFVTGGGQQGIWLRAFEPGDGMVSQTVAGVPGGNYKFSAWSAWEVGYSGGLDPASVNTFIRMEFLDSGSALIGAPLELDLAAAGQVNDDGGGTEQDDWRQFMLNGVSPAGTAFVRVSVGATGMFDSGINPQSAFFDDLSLDLAAGIGAVASVPEPAAGCLMVIAICGILGIRERR